jgi:hypothetical protein
MIRKWERRDGAEIVLCVAADPVAGVLGAMAPAKPKQQKPAEGLEAASIGRLASFPARRGHRERILQCRIIETSFTPPGGWSRWG